MKRQLDEHDHIFDGFAHRNFNPSTDGWRNALPDMADYQSVKNARDVLCLFDELCAAKQKIWELEQQVKMLKPFAAERRN
jgi:hypothetical protein